MHHIMVFRSGCLFLFIASLMNTVAAIHCWSLYVALVCHCGILHSDQLKVIVLHLQYV